MRIIEKNYQDKEQEYEITCPHCKSKLAYKFDDVISDSFNDNWIYCPVCNKEISIYDSETPTIETIQYPRDFFSYANGASIRDEQINEWIKDAVNRLDKDVDCSGHASGDTIVLAYKSDEDASEATVIVAKKYQEADVKISSKNF